MKNQGCGGRASMVYGFTITHAIGTYHHNLNPNKTLSFGTKNKHIKVQD